MASVVQWLGFHPSKVEVRVRFTAVAHSIILFAFFPLNFYCCRVDVVGFLRQKFAQVLADRASAGTLPLLPHFER